MRVSDRRGRPHARVGHKGPRATHTAPGPTFCGNALLQSNGPRRDLKLPLTSGVHLTTAGMGSKILRRAVPAGSLNRIGAAPFSASPSKKRRQIRRGKGPFGSEKMDYRGVNELVRLVRAPIGGTLEFVYPTMARGILAVFLLLGLFLNPMAPCGIVRLSCPSST